MGILEDYQAQDQWRDWQAMIRQLPIKKNQTVLDLGCGPGLMSKRLASRCERVIGLDQDDGFLEAARHLCPSNCEFINADLTGFDASGLAPADGLWSSFTAAYFPTFAPVLERWAECLVPGGWLALVEIDDLFTGHHPLPEDIQTAFRDFMDNARTQGHYDFCMGHRLRDFCEAVGLTVMSEHSWKDRELAFDGKASTEILNAWTNRFERMGGMQAYLGPKRFHQVKDAFLEAISSAGHYSTSSVKMVLAKRPE